MNTTTTATAPRIELTKEQAKELRKANGMYGFALAQKWKRQAKALANEAALPCSVAFKDEVFYVIHPEAV